MPWKYGYSLFCFLLRFQVFESDFQKSLVTLCWSKQKLKIVQFSQKIWRVWSWTNFSFFFKQGKRKIVLLKSFSKKNNHIFWSNFFNLFPSFPRNSDWMSWWFFGQYIFYVRSVWICSTISLTKLLGKAGPSSKKQKRTFRKWILCQLSNRFDPPPPVVSLSVSSFFWNISTFLCTHTVAGGF